MTKRISVSAFQNNPTKYFHECQNEPVEVMKYGQTLGFLVPPTTVQNRSVFIGSLNTNFSSAIKEDHEEAHTHQE